MNERLKEIAVKAQVEHCISHVRLEEFAELIVRECAGVCDLYAMPDGTSETAMILSAAIKRKFGVES
jgi:hypothetical protein